MKPRRQSESHWRRPSLQRWLIESKRMKLCFRRLRDADFETAYFILTESVPWLLSRGIRQWTRPFPRHLYLDSQSNGSNYGMFDCDTLLSIVTLRYTTDEHWKEEIGTEPRWWLSKLAVRLDRHGEGFGGLTVTEAIHHLSNQSANEVWLDCVQGRLPDFYVNLGFDQIATKVVTYASGPFDMVLLKRTIPNSQQTGGVNECSAAAPHS